YGINWIWTSTAPYLAHYPRIDSPASPSGTLLVAETKTAALGTSFIIPGTAHLHNLPNFHEAGNIHVLYFGGNVGSVAHTDVQDVSSEFVDNLFGRRPETNEPQL